MDLPEATQRSTPTVGDMWVRDIPVSQAAQRLGLSEEEVRSKYDVYEKEYEAYMHGDIDG